MLRHALKEWAVICRALAEGKQSLLLRKGGIAEPGGDFAVEHTRFWLMPTYTHQQRAGIADTALPLLEAAEADRPAAGVLRLTHWAEVTGMYQVRELGTALERRLLILGASAIPPMPAANVPSSAARPIGRPSRGVGVGRSIPPRYRARAGCPNSGSGRVLADVARFVLTTRRGTGSRYGPGLPRQRA